MSFDVLSGKDKNSPTLDTIMHALTYKNACTLHNTLQHFDVK